MERVVAMDPHLVMERATMAMGKEMAATAPEEDTRLLDMTPMGRVDMGDLLATRRSAAIKATLHPVVVIQDILRQAMAVALQDMAVLRQDMAVDMMAMAWAVHLDMMVLERAALLAMMGTAVAKVAPAIMSPAGAPAAVHPCHIEARS